MAKQTYGQWLRTNRKKRNITGPMIERLTGVSASHLSRIEKGRIVLPDVDTRERLHEVLGTSEDDLVEAGILTTFEWPGSDHVTYLDAAVIQEEAAIHATREPTAPDDALQGIHTAIDAARLTTDQVAALTTILEAFRTQNDGT